MKGPQHLLRRCNLLDAVRGCLEGKTIHRRQPKPLLPAFPLQSNHFGNLLAATPSEFHSTLCNLIRNAQERVYLASLYIGPGASPHYHAELELLDALGSTSENVNVKIVMDHNRALRKVPSKNGSATSSAEAVAKAIRLQSNHTVHLFQVLPSPLDSLLPNPLNEVAGVFHIKAYIIDDSLILSGANLSQEYFSDRQDRYLWIRDGGNGLVDFYAQLIDVLSDNSATYSENNQASSKSSVSKAKLLTQINQLFRDDNGINSEELLSNPDTAAVCIPTFHAPRGFWPEHPSYRTDVEATLDLLQEGADSEAARVHLSSAYLNPTTDLLRAVSKYPEVNMVTAGRLSHGFRPKNHTAGNKGKAWIPTVFDHLAYETSKQTHAQLYHWERQDWTFHSKGLWVEQEKELAAAVVGSSNFGGRSFVRDMESNLLMVFPPTKDSKITQSLQEELDELMHHSKRVDAKELVESAPPLPLHVQSLLPYIKSFF
jgi:CDP-diacylglycerol--glycerol-3-phosphate 3-phosphatidyltransferase